MLDTRRWITRFAELVAADADRLTRLDAAIGDGDHGTNLNRGLRAAVAALEDDLPPGKVLMTAGRALIAKTGGASGPLYGTALRRAGKALGESPEVEAEDLATALRAAVDAVRELGGAEDGDKTMLDALTPAVTAYETALAGGERSAAASPERGPAPATDANQSPPAVEGAEPGLPGGEGAERRLASAAEAALRAAETGAEATIPLQARKGRASYLGPRSVGHLDPGAASTVLLFRALAETVGR